MASRRPVPRNGAYEHYWRFAAERHRVFLRRTEGAAAPFTDDPVIMTFKFCNTYRAADRVSQYLIRHISYPYQATDSHDSVFQTVLFRTFSREATWEHLNLALGGPPRIQHLTDGSLENALTSLRSAGQRLYTGAFILCATDAYGRGLKHLNHIELYKKMFLNDDFAEQALEQSSLGSLYRLIHEYPLMGDFMSYQIAIDLNYSPLFAFSEDEFTQPGPGAMRGLRKIFLDSGGLSPAELVHWLVGEQHEAFDRLGLEFPGLWGRALTAVDCQNLLCETDKYLRVVAPQLASNRTRIKARFAPSLTPLPLFFPPKWEINHLLPTSPPPAEPQNGTQETQLTLL